MSKNCISYAGLGNEGIPGFDWSQYEDGWNGSSLKANKKVKTANGDVVYSREPYAAKMYKKLSGAPTPVSKEIRKQSVVAINDIDVLNNDYVIATINGGANNIVIDLNKEQRFFNYITLGNTALTKESFIECLKQPELKSKLLAMDLTAKIGTDTSKASIWDGYVETLTNEMKNQVSANTKAYMATVLATNRGGFVVEISGIIKAFMPGSMAAANRITDYESLVGSTMEVMVESYNPITGFVVSRKKYLKTIMPHKINNLLEQLKQDQDMVFTGTITGATQFGVFVELDEYITGMLHKSLVDDEVRDQMRKGTIQAGTTIDVYVHKIENNRVILSNVPSSQREDIIAKREAEDESEKAAAAAEIVSQAVKEGKEMLEEANKQVVQEA